MCYILYMASDKILPLIPYDPEQRAFCVQEPGSYGGDIRTQFTKAHVYELGSDQGCGCGFPGEHDWMNEDPEKLAATRDNQERLSRYLAACLEDEDSLELYGCWNGDESLPPVRHREITPQDVLGERFHFIEKEHILVKSSHAGTPPDPAANS
ncbi:hypothetical protein [Luteolibacter sp. Populi]|uniref:hypothetical protein n=1 Tax=Luteolibacter sp. Populi TaxID=3230487 RepID=UPI0034656693